MAFAVEDFHDLVELLEAHPDWRSELRRLMLTDELLGLPLVVRHLAERVDALAERTAGLAQRTNALAERTDALAERMDVLAERMDALTDAQRRTAEQLARVAEQMAGLAEAQRWTADRVGKLLGDAVERRYRERAPAYFAKLLRRIRTLSSNELAELADDALAHGRLSETDRRELLSADIVAHGRRYEDGQDAYLVVEVSSRVDADDVLRATERAAVLGKITGTPVIAAVAGEEASLDARDAARDRHAWQVLDGIVVPPDAAPA